MINVMWQIQINGYRFDFLLAFLAFLTWFKLFLYFRTTQTFGPMLRILQQMMTDLAKFMSIWLILLMMFVCVAMLAFGQLETFKSMDNIIFMLTESAFGNWDLAVYEGENLSLVSHIGIYFHIVFLLVNTVLMLNFAIAILS